MIDYNKIIIQQLTVAECIKKDRKVFIKYIICKIADPDLFPSSLDESYRSNIFSRMENKLEKKNKHELVEILMNENNEMKSMFSEIKDEILREIIDSFDSEDESDDEDKSKEYDSDIDDEDEFSDSIHSDYVEIIRRLIRGKKVSSK